jgi:hypothetical protein
MGRSQWSIATAWHETALPVPVHAAAIMGESMEQTRARMTEIDTDRRILQTHYNFIPVMKAIGFRVAERFCHVKIFNSQRHRRNTILLSLFQQLWFTLCRNENFDACPAVPVDWVRRDNSPASSPTAFRDFLWRFHFWRLEP